MKKILVLLIIILTSQAQIKKTYQQAFTKIDISLNADTRIMFGDEHKLEMTGHEDDLDRIDFGVRNGTLYIEIEGSKNWNWFKKRQKDIVKIRITIRNLDDLDVSGQGEVILAKLDQEDLKIDISGTVDLEAGGRVDYLVVDKSGAGNVYLKNMISKKINIDKSGAGSMEMSGKARRLNIDCSGASSLDFEDFVVDVLEADMSGANSMRITVNDEVSADLSGACSIKFKGRADIVYKDTSGASSVRRMRD